LIEVVARRLRDLPGILAAVGAEGRSIGLTVGSLRGLSVAISTGRRLRRIFALVEVAGLQVRRELRLGQHVLISVGLSVLISVSVKTGYSVYFHLGQ
jgi:hypothetical protein